MGNSLLLDKRVQKLSGNALRLYLSHRPWRAAGSGISSFPGGGKKYGICPAGLWRGHDRAGGEGLPSPTGPGRTVRQPNEYVFSLEWRTGEKPPAFRPLWLYVVYLPQNERRRRAVFSPLVLAK